MLDRFANSGLLFGALLLASMPALAHHSFGAEFDGDKPVTITGVVTKIEWINPHSHFYLDVKDDKGAVVNWRLDGYPPVVLSRTGWRRDETLKPGDKITVSGWLARDGTKWAHGRQVIFQDGKKLYFGPPAGTGDGGTKPAVDAPQ